MASQYKFIKYVRSQQNLILQVAKYKRRSLVWMGFGLGALLLVVYLALHQTTYLIPYGLEQKTAVSVSRVTPYYLEQLARSDALTYFDVTPQTVKQSATLFLTRVLPSLYGPVQVQLGEREKTYQKDNIVPFWIKDRNYGCKRPLRGILMCFHSLYLYLYKGPYQIIST